MKLSTLNFSCEVHRIIGGCVVDVGGDIGLLPILLFIRLSPLLFQLIHLNQLILRRHQFMF
jgi:hypothetical protein